MILRKLYTARFQKLNGSIELMNIAKIMKMIIPYLEELILIIMVNSGVCFMLMRM